MSVGSAAIYNRVVEERIAHIQGIFDRFEKADRDQSLIDAAASQPAAWSEEEWATIGKPTTELAWIRDDLALWAQRVMSREQEQAAKAVAADDASDEAGVSTAFGVDYKQCVHKLRDLGLKMLQLASLGERKQISSEAIRSEIDNHVQSVAAYSDVVQRGVNASAASKTVEVHNSETFRSAALQQRLIQKLEVQVAQQEALIATLRKEGDEQHEALLKAEERIRHVTFAASQKPPQRSRATECNILPLSVSIGVQVAPHREVEENEAISFDTSVSSATRLLMSSSTATARPSRVGAQLLELPKPHEVFILQNKIEQQKFMFVSLLALYRKSKRGQAQALRVARGCQTLPWHIPEPKERACSTLAAELIDGLERSAATDSEVWGEVVHAIDRVMSATPQVDLLEARTRAMALAMQDASATDTEGSKGTAEPIARRGRSSIHFSEKEREANRALASIGELLGSNISSTGSPLNPPESQQHGNGIMKAKLLAKQNGSRPEPEPIPKHTVAVIPPIIAKTLTTISSVTPRISTCTQTTGEVVVAAPVRWDKSTQVAPAKLSMDTPRELVDTLSLVTSVGIPRAPETATDENEIVDNSDAPRNPIDSRSSLHLSGTIVDSQTDSSRRSTALPIRPASGCRRTMQYSRPHSAHRVEFPKRFTVPSPQDMLKLSMMETRYQKDQQEFEAFRTEVEELKRSDAEMALEAPKTDSSSHHFAVSDVVREHEYHPTVPPRLPFTRLVEAEVEALPPTTVLTPRGVTTIQPQCRSSTAPDEVHRRMERRPPPFVVPDLPE